MRHLIIRRSVSVSSCLLFILDDEGSVEVEVDDDGDNLLVKMMRTLAGLSESSKSRSLSSCPSFIARQNVEMPPINLE